MPTMSSKTTVRRTTVPLLPADVKRWYFFLRVTDGGELSPPLTTTIEPLTAWRAGWGEGQGWETQGAGAHETRLRLLTLQGQWLETKGHLLAGNNSPGGGQVKLLTFQ